MSSVASGSPAACGSPSRTSARRCPTARSPRHHELRAHGRERRGDEVAAEDVEHRGARHHRRPARLPRDARAARRRSRLRRARAPDLPARRLPRPRGRRVRGTRQAAPRRHRAAHVVRRIPRRPRGPSDGFYPPDQRGNRLPSRNPSRRTFQAPTPLRPPSRTLRRMYDPTRRRPGAGSGAQDRISEVLGRWTTTAGGGRSRRPRWARGATGWRLDPAGLAARQGRARCYPRGGARAARDYQRPCTCARISRS